MTNDELKKLCDTATRGPWGIFSNVDNDEEYEKTGNENFEIGVIGPSFPDGRGICTPFICRTTKAPLIRERSPEGKRAIANAEFIAAAREAVPRLLTESVELRKVIERVLNWAIDLADGQLSSRGWDFEAQIRAIANGGDV